MGADNPGWVPPEAGAVRALPIGLTLMDQARVRKHDTDLGNPLTVIRLPGRVLTGGRAAAIKAAGAASQIPAECNPEVYDGEFWSRVNARAGQFGLTRPVGRVQASGAG